MNLSDREVAVLQLLADGSTERAICRDLGITMPMAKRAKVSIRRKLGARTTAHAVWLAWHAGVVV